MESITGVGTPTILPKDERGTRPVGTSSKIYRWFSVAGAPIPS
jgi:hypothetical protein